MTESILQRINEFISNIEVLPADIDFKYYLPEEKDKELNYTKNYEIISESLSKAKDLQRKIVAFLSVNFEEDSPYVSDVSKIQFFDVLYGPHNLMWHNNDKEWKSGIRKLKAILSYIKIELEEKIKRNEINKNHAPNNQNAPNYKIELNKLRNIARNKFIDKMLFKWRFKAWLNLGLSVGVTVIFIIVFSRYNALDLNETLREFYSNKWLSIFATLVYMIFNVFIINDIYNKHKNYSNINNYISHSINPKIPPELNELE